MLTEKATATLDSLNLGFFNPTVPGSINLSARLKDLFVRKNNLSPKFFLLGNMLKGKPYPHFSMQWGEQRSYVVQFYFTPKNFLTLTILTSLELIGVTK
jgi:hypothetical protein